MTCAGAGAALHHGAARAPGQDLSGRHGGEPERAVGQYARGARGLSPRVAARPVRERRRAAGRSAPCARRATRSATSSPRRRPTVTGIRTSGSAAPATGTGVQLDETAFPVLLAATLDEREALGGTEVADMIARALCFLVRHGPGERPGPLGGGRRTQHLHARACASPRWSPAPLCSSRRRASSRSPSPTTGTRSWRSGPRVRDTPLARLYGVPGYYVRVAPGESA